VAAAVTVATNNKNPLVFGGEGLERRVRLNKLVTVNRGLEERRKTVDAILLGAATTICKKDPGDIVAVKLLERWGRVWQRMGASDQHAVNIKRKRNALL